MSRPSSFKPLVWSAGLAALCVGVALAASAQDAAAPAKAEPAVSQKAAAPRPHAAQKGMQVIDTSKPFDHDTHLNPEKVGQGLQCTSCHGGMTTSDGQCPKEEVRFPKHEACTSCHAASFFTQPLTICTNCHKSAAFAAQNPLRELTRQVTPRKAEFSHLTHLSPGGAAAKMAGQKVDCTSCHELKKGGEVVSHPSHPNCCNCHTKENVAPKMQDCQGCHSAEKNAGRPPSKIHSFSHKLHREDPRTGSSLACTTCHINGHQAKTLRQIQIPPMQTCVTCHEGQTSFHFSSCLKCHIPGSIQGVPLPPTHPTDPAPEGAKQ